MSYRQHSFGHQPQANIRRSSFDRSHGVKLTADASWLVPFYVDEALPGDSFNLRSSIFGRLATPIKPIMDNLTLQTFFFFIPNRLVWDKWEDFMGNNADAADPEQENQIDVPIITLPPAVPQAREHSIYDYMGLPIHSDAAVNAQAMPFRAYNLVWNEWFRHEALQDEVDTNYQSDGPDNILDYNLLKRGKRHDYFTSALPWPQRGEDVTIPTLGTATVIPQTGGGSPILGSAGNADTSLTAAGSVVSTTIGGQTGVLNWRDPQLEVDLTTATTATINDLRVAFQLQKMLERDARGGTRYTEIIQAHFNVVSDDARLNRPEYLGGGQSRVNINPVQQTTQDIDGAGANTPQGNLAAYGTVSASGHGFTKSFTEHGILLGLLNIRADLTYQEGLERMWIRRGRYDFFWPAFQHVGEQAIWADELYASSDNDITPVFGYTERYNEYRYKPSKILGKFRSESPQSLDIWHLSQDFSNTPLLNAEFIQDDAPVDRIIAVQDEPHFLIDVYNKLKCARPMPLFGVPGNIDRF